MRRAEPILLTEYHHLFSLDTYMIYPVFVQLLALYVFFSRTIYLWNIL